MTEGLVDVHLFAAARAAVGVSTVAVPAGTLADILDGLVAQHPGFGPVRVRCSYLIDEVSVRDLNVAVAPGSRVDVLPPFAGG